MLPPELREHNEPNNSGASEFSGPVAMERRTAKRKIGCLPTNAKQDVQNTDFRVLHNRVECASCLAYMTNKHGLLCTLCEVWVCNRCIEIDGVDLDASKFLCSICSEISGDEPALNPKKSRTNRYGGTLPMVSTEHSGSGTTKPRSCVAMESSRMELKIIENTQDEPTLEAAQRFVGGYVQDITFPNGDHLLLNENGKTMNLKKNYAASELWHVTFGYDDWVSGPAILIKKPALNHWA